MEKGLRATIHRFGSVGFDIKKGFFNESDYICQMVSAVLKSSMKPPAGAITAEHVLHQLPVDVAALQMVRLAQGVERGVVTNQPFSLTGQFPLSWDSLVGLANTTGLAGWCSSYAGTSAEGPVFSNVWARGIMEACPLLSFKTDGKVLSPSQMIPVRHIQTFPTTEEALRRVSLPYVVEIPPESVLQFLNNLLARSLE